MSSDGNIEIEIDFEVFKKLTYERTSQQEDLNGVLRRILQLADKPLTTSGMPWVSEGVLFPHGTQFRGTYKGKMYLADIVDGDLIVNGQSARGLSHAAKIVTGTNRNGWFFWEYKRPEDSEFRLATSALAPHRY